MSLPGNGIFVVRGEMSTLLTAMRRGSRNWNSSAYVDEEKDPLLKQFVELKIILSRIEDLRLIDPNVFLMPFLDVIRTDETTGAVTSLALAAINKFLSYGLIDPTSPNLAVTVDYIVDAVTHARFMGTDQSSDGVTLFRVVEVLHTLMRSPEGSALTNEAVCEIMLSCFKICFEPRLNELLRRFAEQALKDMVLLLFMRLPQFSEDRSEAGLLKKFQMMAASMEQDKKQRKKLSKKQSNGQQYQQQRSISMTSVGTTTEERKASTVSNPANSDPQTPEVANSTLGALKAPPLATTPATPAGNILDMQGKITQTPTTALEGGGGGAVGISRATTTTSTEETPSEASAPMITIEPSSPPNATEETKSGDNSNTTPVLPADGSNEYINSVGVRFTQQNSLDGSEATLLPYGLPCIQELFRFLIMLCNPLDKQNTDTMMHMGLSLLTVAFEVGADNIGRYDTLLELVRDELCRNLIALMTSERLTIFAADLQVCFLMFESLRGHLKFQMEAYLKKLTEIIASDNPKTPYEMRELALDNLLQLWRIPGFVAELYINYDCDLYCTDLFESITNLLSKYTLSATNAVYSTHIIAMDALISVIEHIERNCKATKNLDNTMIATPTTPTAAAPPVTTTTRHSRHNSGLEGIIIGDSHNSEDKTGGVVENISKFLNSSSRLRLESGSAADERVTREHLDDVKQKKRVLTQGTELFNQRPDKGIQYLQENGILSTQLDPMEVALFLRENPALDKKMIGEYISKKKNVDSKILMNFVDSFDFAGLRIDQALRLYLETFRLPGEAPLIFLVLEHFADHWHKQNGEPFANTDSAFSLAYAIIMLNMDQHNSNAKRLNIPMTSEDFLKNLRGLNGGSDFDQDMLATIFNAIKNEEIVMPAEQTGLVRENYLWKVLLRRGSGSDGIFKYVQDAVYDLELFKIIWGASLSALGFMFDKSSEHGYQRTLTGFTKCAAISAHYSLHEDFDALILTLGKFTTLLTTQQPDVPTPNHNEIIQAVNFGLNPKAQAAIRTVFALIHDYGDCLRESWKNILDIYLQLFRLKLLPKGLTEVEDFCELNGKAQLILAKPYQKQEVGLFSSLYSYLSSEGQREPTYEEQECIKIARKCIKECQLEQMIQETKFVQLESLQELLKCLLNQIKAPSAHKTVNLPYAEDVVVFWMEYLVKIVIHNRDRMIPLWPAVRDQMYLLLLGSASCGYDYLLNRSIVAVLKLAIYLMRNEELCPIVLQSLKMLLMLKPAILLRISKQISIGIYELLKTSAQNIHSEQDWQIIFTILECVGAGAVPPEFDDTFLPVPNGLSGAKSDGGLSSEDDSGLPDRGYISDSEVSNKKQQQQQQQQIQQKQLQHSQHSNTSSPFPSSPTSENWILVNKDTDLTTLSRPQSPPNYTAPSLSTLIYNCKLIEHSPFALFKCWDSLAFIVRNVAHITPYNFESCVRCIRTFVEACRDGGIRQRRLNEAAAVAAKTNQNDDKKKKSAAQRREREAQRKAGTGSAHASGPTSSSTTDNYGSNAQSDNEADSEDLAQRYETLSIQLLDLMYTLYTRTAQIFRWWAEEGCAVPQCSALWAQGWCPLLQGIARLAMDRRREVRTYAISCLQQRALLVHDLQTLSGTEWSSCFYQVLFPLLNELLPESTSVPQLDSVLLEESRIRMATIMSKVFLHHLTPLIELGSSFNELWIEILNYIEKFMKVGSDMLSEQMQEILKNMLLVMHSVRVFHLNDGGLNVTLWELTWRRIGEFLPNLQQELFRDEGSRIQQTAKSTVITSPTPSAMGIPPTVITSSTSSTNSPINDLAQLPQVAILPQQQQQQQPIPLRPQQQSLSQFPTERLVSQTPIVSPIESPRHSIILQPPETDFLQSKQPFLLNQLPSTQQTFFLPQIQSQSPRDSAATSPTFLLQSNMPKLIQPQPIMATEITTTKQTTDALKTLPDLVNDASKINTYSEFQQQQTPTKQSSDDMLGASKILNATITSDLHTSCSFSIELPDNVANNGGYYSQSYAVEQQNQQEHHNYQQNFHHNEQQQQYYQHYQSSPGNEMENPSCPTTIEETKSSESIPNLSATTMSNDNNINVPISHLLAGNQYPSLQKTPNAAIVHSFSPMYVQSQAPQSGADIYQDYMQNPYNLTLQEHQHQQQQQKQQQQQLVTPTLQAEEQQQTPLLQQSVFGMTSSASKSPANYFNVNVDPSMIPPGSEMLYGQP